jgi:hypothetical protein
MKKILFLLVLFLSISQIKAQETMSDHEDHEGHLENHDHHNNEIGIANSIVYFQSEKEFNYGLHLHYVRNIAHTKFGIGLAYEKIFDEHKHNTFGIAAIYRPIEGLNLNFSPGIATEGLDFSEARIALHFETSYEFQLNNVHLGPAIELAWDQEDIHLSLGLHLGFGF